MKKNNLLIVTLIGITMALSSCDSNRNKATLGKSLDTGNTRKGAGGNELDKRTINDIKKDSANKQTDTVPNKGNADPKGNINGQSKK
jgi:hypothetical protein